MGNAKRIAKQIVAIIISRCRKCGKDYRDQAKAIPCPACGNLSDADDPQVRLEYLRRELRAERISQGEIVELQSLVKHISPDDVELLEAAGVPEE